MPTGNTYVIIYGWLSDGASGEPNARANAVAAAGTPLVIAQYRAAPPAAHRNLSAQVLSVLHESGSQVFAYIATDWGRADLRDVQRTSAEYLAAGIDGIFLDEADSLCSDTKLQYYAQLASHVRDSGGKLILNPGVSQCGEKIMQLCDLVMLEHAWRDAFTRSPWLRRYPAERVMGVSSNEDNAMGYPIDEQRAIDDTREAWQRGIGWHTSTDRYVDVPEWFGRYVEALR